MSIAELIEEQARDGGIEIFRRIQAEFPDPEYTPEQIEAQAALIALRNSKKPVTVHISMWNFIELEKLARAKSRSVPELLRKYIRLGLVKDGVTLAD